MFKSSYLEAKTGHLTKTLMQALYTKTVCSAIDTNAQTEPPRQEFVHEIEDISNDETEDEEPSVYTDVSDPEPITDN